MYFPRFPSRFQKFIRVPAEHLQKTLSQVLGECEKAGEKKVFKTSVGRGTGVTLRVRLLPEGEVSSIEFAFSYQGLAILILAFLIALIGLSLLLSSAIPLIGLIIIPLLAYRADSAVERSLSELDNILRALETEYARRKISEERARWQCNPKNVDALYRRLREKHLKIWGSTYVLEYKMNEYQRQGLTREEAIRKIAEEEGIF